MEWLRHPLVILVGLLVAIASLVVGVVGLLLADPTTFATSAPKWLALLYRLAGLALGSVPAMSYQAAALGFALVGTTLLVLTAIPGVSWAMNALRARRVRLPSPLLLVSGNTQEFERWENPSEGGMPPAWERQVKLLKVMNNGNIDLERCSAAIEVTERPLPHTPVPIALTWGDWRAEREIPAGKDAYLRLYWDEVRTATGSVADFPPTLASHSVPFTVAVRSPGYRAARRSYRLQEVSREAVHPQARGRLVGVPTITETQLLPGPSD